jgi:hypothetical protein
MYERKRREREAWRKSTASEFECQKDQFAVCGNAKSSSGPKWSALQSHRSSILLDEVKRCQSCQFVDAAPHHRIWRSSF